MKKDSTITLFYGLSVFMLLYMAFSAFTSFFSFKDYCATNNLAMSDMWFTGFQSILAAIIPCLVYAATLYGIAKLLEKKEENKENKGKNK